MSTYLLFFGVDEFSFIKDKGDVVVRVATQPGSEKYGQFGLQFGRKALEFCQQYYEIDYPLSKLDLISVPDFAFGAMENWGAITFRENLLLHYPGITSKTGEERICEVIAHEIVHQWFGNLVTPSDWKYLWLNESFATYFGYGVVNHYYPEWDMWQQFLSSQTQKALDRDALRETTSIEIPGGEHVIINTSTAPIIYNKGGSVLRQVEGYIGKKNFKRGLQGYLRKYQYSCASSHHLWESLEDASKLPVTPLMKSWIEQPGFPMVHVQRSGRKLLLRQERFSYLPNPSSQKWIIPLSIRFFYKDRHSETVSVLFQDKRLEMDIPQDVVAYKLNDAQMGFYRVMYHDEDNFHRLGEKVLAKDLSPEDRWGLQNDLYALVKSGAVSLNRYLGFLSNYDFF